MIAQPQVFESSILPQEATNFLSDFQAQQAQEEAKRARSAALSELLEWCNQWLRKAKDWRKQSYETDWLAWQRNADAEYNPEIAARKEGWQSKVFVPVTPSHRETCHAALYRMIAGARPPLEMHPRPGGTEDQAQDIRDMILREMEKSEFESGLNTGLDEATTYGSSFFRMRWENKYEDRKKRKPVYGEIDPLDSAQIEQSFQSGPPVVGYEDVIEPSLIYRGTRFEHISIWDLFPDPKALCVKGNPHAYRFRLAYGDVMEGVEKGYYLPEAPAAIENAPTDEIEPEDKAQVNVSRGIADVEEKRPKYAKTYEIYELFARLPKKWVLINGEEFDDPEKLIPARVLFHKSTVCAVELNDAYDGEAPYIKLDYIPIAGEYYALGVPEMLKDIQEVISETVNQRIDNVSLCLNKMLAVIEKALVDSKDLTSRPGQMIRISAKALGPNGDVRQAIMPIEFGDVTRSSYSDVLEFERYAQERTGANRVTMGTQGLVKDTNDTLGGQELAKQSAGEKFAWVGMVMEFGFLHKVFRKYWSLIYSNIDPQDVVAALGQERAMQFQLMSPEDVDMGYRYEPQGIFEMENKAVAQAMLQSVRQQFAGLPWIDDMAFFDKIVKKGGEDPTTLKLSPEEMQQKLVAEGILAMTSGLPGEPGPAGTPSNGARKAQGGPKAPAVPGGAK